MAAFAGGAAAHPGITGYSGKPYFGASDTCTTKCHAKGGTPPTLSITVPASVQAGSTNAVKIVVAGNKTRTSLNAAFSDGAKTIKGANTDTPLPNEEPTEIAAVVPPPKGATATYDFTFVAPRTAGTLTLWVAGMAANGNGTNGDGVTNATRSITVTGGSTTDAGGESDAGRFDAAAPAEGGVGPVGAADGGGRASSGATSSPDGAPADSGGCAIAARAPAGFVAVAILALAVLGARRRSAPS